MAAPSVVFFVVYLIKAVGLHGGIAQWKDFLIIVLFFNVQNYFYVIEVLKNKTVKQIIIIVIIKMHHFNDPL